MEEYIKMEISNNLKVFLNDEYNKELINTSNWEELFIQMYEFDPNIRDELINCIAEAGIISSGKLTEIATTAKSDWDVRKWNSILNYRYDPYTKRVYVKSDVGENIEIWINNLWGDIREANAKLNVKLSNS